MNKLTFCLSSCLIILYSNCVNVSTTYSEIDREQLCNRKKKFSTVKLVNKGHTLARYQTWPLQTSGLYFEVILFFFINEGLTKSGLYLQGDFCSDVVFKQGLTVLSSQMYPWLQDYKFFIGPCLETQDYQGSNVHSMPVSNRSELELGKYIYNFTHFKQK